MKQIHPERAGREEFNAVVYYNIFFSWDACEPFEKAFNAHVPI